MECKKEEATKAKSIAEERFNRKNYNDAKKFALKAQALYPDLKGISQMISNLDVCIAADIKGEVDHYAMLNVDPSADKETIKKKYRKMALVHHPDKNKSVGAEDAFKLVLESYNLLADKAKRLEYDGRRAKLQEVAQNQSNGDQHHGNKAQSQQNGTPNMGSETASVPKAQRSSTRNSRKRKRTQTPNTFWTMCDYCGSHYEYAMLYLNNRLLCGNCKKPFMAKETAPPPRDEAM